MKPRILAVTPGDPAGIGPEIVWKALRALPATRRRYALLCIGAREPFRRLRAPVIEVTETELRAGALPPKRATPFVWLLPAPVEHSKFDTEPALAGYQSGWSIAMATHLVLDGVAEALVTGPISKERLQAGGYSYAGHTEFLADLCRSGRRTPAPTVPTVPTMMLANDRLRISLVTTHIALRDVPQALSRDKIRRAVLHTAESLRLWWGIRRPKIAVAALNPHAGEGGIMGREEIEVITPTLQELRAEVRSKFILDGPLPADTLFANHVLGRSRYDAVVCMYHDQGLIPVKLLDFPKTVNVTLGLPIIRTSVDHGVAFDLVGRGKADPSSLKSAVNLAIQILER